MTGAPIGDSARSYIEHILGRAITAAEMGATASFLHFTDDDVADLRRLLGASGLYMQCIQYRRRRVSRTGTLSLATTLVERVARHGDSIEAWWAVENRWR